MSDCSCFKINTQNVPRNDMGKPPTVMAIKTPWCSHERSPAPLRKAVSTIGGDQLLSCGGFVAMCPIQNR
jgi:hypothetical protein